jgi:glycosyltransferase involved in cell wall biosynthesis
MPNSPIHILFASRLVYEKWADILVEIIHASMVWEYSMKNIIWHICSDGPYRGEIEDLVTQFPERVIYHWSLAQSALADLYRRVDFLFMPSRFLETFGLTALESLACRTPVIGFAKGGLIPFIPKKLSLIWDDVVTSFFSIIQAQIADLSEAIEVDSYSEEVWISNIISLFAEEHKKITLLHDYHEKIGGAEYYVSHIEEILRDLSYDVSRFGYEWKANIWKRRWMFTLSLFTVYRGARLSRFLSEKNPDIIWMHSIQRYIGYWWMRAVMKYVKISGAKIYLSHHDVGLISPFPQDITEEGQIPQNPSLRAFIAKLSPIKKSIASIKWFYIKLLRSRFPENMEHIIFASFLDSHIKKHFPQAKIHTLPHSYDEAIFYP